MRRRRKIMIVLASFAAALFLLTALSAAFRYHRWRSCARIAGRARAAAGSLEDARLRADLEAHAEYLQQRIDRGWLYSKRDVFLGRLLAEAEAVLAAAKGEVDSPHLLPGHHVIVRISGVDGARLPTSVTVPDGWDGKTPLPMVLHLHSGGVTEMIHCSPAPAIEGAVSVMPLARGSHDYLGVQMTAVLECVQDAWHRYPHSRLFVMGTSMGGMGAWLFAQRSPNRIGGVSPWCGNADPAAWQGVWERPREEPRSPASRAHRTVRASRSPVARVKQLLTSPQIPIYIGHGTADTIIPIGHSESMYEKLRDPSTRLARSGSRPEFIEGREGKESVRFERFEGYGHRLPRMYRERFEWLRGRAPGGELRAGTTVIPPLAFVDDFSPSLWQVAVDPLREARYSYRRRDLGPGQNMLDVTDATNAAFSADESPTKARFPGPACNVFEFPFYVALPADTPAHIAACADELASIWRRRYRGEIRRSDAAKVYGVYEPRTGPDSEIERRGLVAIGSPEENPAVRDALGGLDVSVEAGRVRLFGRELEGDDIALIMLRPSTQDTYARTLVVWGSTHASYRQLWRRFANAIDWEGDRGRWWFDYAVFDRRTCGPDTFLAVGFFDHEWKFDEKLLFEGSTELRAVIPGTHWPAGIPSRHLSSMPPASIDSLRGPVGFDRSAGVDAGALAIQGKTFARGIGMVPPASVTWNIGRRFSKLTVTVGLERTGADFAVRHGAERVRFEIWGDGARLAASEALSATSGARDLQADLAGVATLELRAVTATRHVWHCGPVGWGGTELGPAE